MSPFSFKDFDFPRYGGNDRINVGVDAETDTDGGSNYYRSTRSNKIPPLSHVFPPKQEIEGDFSAGFFGNSRPFSQEQLPSPPTQHQHQHRQHQRPQEGQDRVNGDDSANLSNEYDDVDPNEEFEVEVRPVLEHEHIDHGFRQPGGGSPAFRPPLKNPILRSKPPKLSRPKHPKNFGPGNPRLLLNNGPTGPRSRPFQAGKPGKGHFSYPRLDDSQGQVLRRPPQESYGRTTTPRPIPTPGPEDFPPPPPTRPTVPPTIPTHPPLITHPPSHFLPAHIPGNSIGSSKFVDDDYDIGDKNFSDDSGDDGDNGEAGFFEVPAGFPSLDTLGADFESMKIRNKRSAMDLDGGEQRFRRRQFSEAPPFRPNRHRRQHSGNNDYSFQQNFWDDVDIDTREFFTPQQQGLPFTKIQSQIYSAQSILKQLLEEDFS